MKIPQFLLCLIPALAFATEIPEKDWEYVRLDDDHVSIYSSDQTRRPSAIDQATEGDITIPSTLRSMQVVSIGEKAFYNCSKLTSVTIPEGVTNIAAYAFWGCTSLTNVVFPTSLKSIGTYAFDSCNKLTALNLVGASMRIGAHAFRDCSHIGGLSFAGDLISIGDQAFSGCTGLREVSLSAKTVTIGIRTFSIYHEGVYIYSSACTALTNVLIVASDVTVEQTAFSGCTALQGLGLFAESLSLGERAFSRYYYYNNNSIDPCISLSKVTLTAENSATFGETVFSECSNLISVDLPFALRDVPTNAFCKCTSLGSVVFSTNVTHISYRSFDTCTSLKSIGLVEGLVDIDAQAFYGCAVTNLAFPQSLQSIGARAFERCTGLAEVVLAEGNAKLIAAENVAIGERAFYQCESLTNACLSQAVLSIGARAFSQCAKLVAINLPTNLTDIAESTFEDCASLSAIDLPLTLNSIGNTAFYGCSALTGFLIPTQNVVSLGAKAFKNTKYWNDYPDDLVVNNGYILGFKNNPVNVTLPDGCKAIPVAMFEGMTTLETVTIPDSVTEIGSRAFNGCSALTGISFKNVTTIGNSAFEGCSSMVTATLSDALTAIPGNCFKDCKSLVSVLIPEAVSSIGEYAFYNCASLVNVSGGKNITKVGDYAFAQCPKMQPFEFPNNVAYGDHVFQGCTWTEHVIFPKVGTLKDEYPQSYTSIKSVVFSSDMTTVTNSACAGCSLLADVRIPEGVTSIGVSAFEGCTSLTSVVMSASVVSVSSNAFARCSNITSLVVSGQFAISAAFSDAPYATMETIEIASGATLLCDGLFAGCAALSSVQIPSSVTSVGDSAFEGCAALTSLKLPTGVTSIGDSAFAGCVGLSPTLIIPASVTSIGDFAFQGCTGLSAVNYWGDCPTVTSNLYVETSESLRSGVLKDKKDSWGGVSPNTNSAALFWPALPKAGGRRLVVWAPTEDDFREFGMMTFYRYDRTGTREIKIATDGIEESPERDGYFFQGWYSQPYSGVEVTSENVADYVTVYAHWSDEEEDPEDPEEPTEYDFSRANKYVGSVLDGETVVGSVQISFAKGKANKTTGETTASATAKVLLLGESQLSMKGTLQEDGSAELSSSRATRTMEIEISSGNTDCLTGSVDGYEIVAYRDLFSSTVSGDKTRANALLKIVKGKYVAVLEASGETAFTSGYAALSVNVGTKGTVKVTGTMPDGTSVSASTPLAILEDDDGADVGCATVVAPMYSKKGGFAFQLTFDSDGVPTLAGVSEWIADKSGTSVPLSGVDVQRAAGLAEGEHAFAVDISSLTIEDVDVETALSPDGTSFTATAKRWTLPRADTVKFVKDEGYVITKDNGNPGALKLTYNSGTGLFSGSFKVYGITSAGRSKTYTATVKGGTLGGVGYGSAVVKKVGSLPVAVE